MALTLSLCVSSSLDSLTMRYVSTLLSTYGVMSTSSVIAASSTAEVVSMKGSQAWPFTVIMEF